MFSVLSTIFNLVTTNDLSLDPSGGLCGYVGSHAANITTKDGWTLEEQKLLLPSPDYRLGSFSSNHVTH